MLDLAIDGLVRRTYSVTFMMNDGTEAVFTRSYGHYYSDTIQAPLSNPYRGGYVFLGWSTSNSEFVPINSSSTVKGNTVIYAAWALDS